ncbi:MAG TPA: hypothetical protein VGO90_17850 [Chthoniobacteraceae bacterium]|jgi:hypothetical protein|nr:hypothetical protein [Chthoniobacteraceae bacterium]
MRKTILLCCWLLTPVALLAYHYGPGQLWLSRDEAGRHIAQAAQMELSENWTGAMAAYAEALTKLPASDQAERWKVRIAQAKARMQSGELPEAMADLDALLTELQKNSGPAALIENVRADLGVAEYYAAWLMRLEGASTPEWTVEVENARQQFRLLAEEKLQTDPVAAKGYQENLEATIRLARMDLSELEGMPLPKFCQGCKNVSQKCRSQCECKAKKPAEKENKDARGAGTGERPRGGS